MRRAGLVFLLATSLSFGSMNAQVSQSPTPANPRAPAIREDQAVTVAQAALTALGGATAVGQIKSWTFQATMGWGNDTVGKKTVTYTLDTQPSPFANRVGGTQYIRSYFVPVVLAAVLASQVQEPRFSVRYRPGTESQLGPTVSFSTRPSFPDQIWHFDGNTGLPIAVEFHLPAYLGSHMSHLGTVRFSDYRSVGGVLYPFTIVTTEPYKLPEILTIQSITPSTTAPSAPPSASPQAGDTL